MRGLRGGCEMTVCDGGCVQIDDYSMVRFLPFDCTDEEGINIVLQHIDFSIQYGEDLDFKEPKVSSLKGHLVSHPWVRRSLRPAPPLHPCEGVFRERWSGPGLPSRTCPLAPSDPLRPPVLPSASALLKDGGTVRFRSVSTG